MLSMLACWRKLSSTGPTVRLALFLPCSFNWEKSMKQASARKRNALFEAYNESYYVCNGKWWWQSETCVCRLRAALFCWLVSSAQFLAPVTLPINRETFLANRLIRRTHPGSCRHSYFHYHHDRAEPKGANSSHCGVRLLRRCYQKMPVGSTVASSWVKVNGNATRVRFE